MCLKMESVRKIKKLILDKNLGNEIKHIEKVSGGLLHKMYKVETDKGVYCVKVLNPEVMSRKEAYGKYLKLGLNYDYKSVNLSNSSNSFKRYGCYFNSFEDDNMIMSTCSNFSDIKYIKINCNELEQFINKLI